MIRVALADGHQVVRDGLQSILERAGDVVIVGSFGEGGSLMEALDSCAPDVIVMEGQLPDGTGAEWTRAIRIARPDARVLILTSAHSEAELVLALDAGVDGYLHKEDTAETFVAALFAVHDGRFFASSATASQLRDLAISDDGRALTPRELEVLLGVREGMTTEEIAERMRLSKSTVKTHLAGAYRKLDARNRVEAMREAVRRGILAQD